MKDIQSQKLFAWVPICSLDRFHTNAAGLHESWTDGSILFYQTVVGYNTTGSWGARPAHPFRSDHFDRRTRSTQDDLTIGTVPLLPAAEAIA
jgi:hypothetical protein